MNFLVQAVLINENLLNYRQLIQLCHLVSLMCKIEVPLPLASLNYIQTLFCSIIRLLRCDQCYNQQFLKIYHRRTDIHIQNGELQSKNSQYFLPFISPIRINSSPKNQRQNILRFYRKCSIKKRPNDRKLGYFHYSLSNNLIINKRMQKGQEVKSVQIEETSGLKSIDSFEELNLNPDLLRGIYAFGFEKPSIIQQKGILPVVSKRDTIAQAQSGTGKTATFSIGVLQLIDPKSPECQAIILAPTRELAQQINKVIFCFSEFINVNTRCCIGGTDPKEDRNALKNGGIQVVVGTPGRIKDLIQRQTLKTGHLKIVVLDEADEMLGRGFVDEIREIFESLPSDIQVCLFSATMPPEIIEMTDKFMKDPVKILVKNQQLTLDGIKQFYISLQEDSQKFGTLIQLYKNMVISQCMVFTNRKERVKELADKLAESKFVVSCISGDMEMSERVNVMKEFRSGSSRILISTDLLGRGIDIQQVNLIINYDLPTDTAKYIHRIGRSGRFGRKGVAINFVTPGDAQFLANLRQYYNTQIEELPLDISKIME